MKKILSVGLFVLLGMSMFAFGAKESSGSKEPSVALIINGNLGDKSFHDSANNGMKMIANELHCKTKVVEVGYDDSKWEPALRDLCDEKHDIIFCGTWQMQALVSKITKDYPNQKIIVYDTTMDYASDSAGLFKNTYSIEYKQNEGSFLAGVLAAEMTKGKKIGFIGGMDNTVILDFLVGFIQGAKTVSPDIKIISSFVGNFSDSAKAKELALTQYQMGADIIFVCASNAGEGALQAAKEKNKFIIGVDSDQAMLYKQTDPVLSNLIISSMLKRVDKSMYLAMKEIQSNTLVWGKRVALGINEGCVGLADNEVYQANVPAEVRKHISEYETQIRNGKIAVKTAFGMKQADITAYIDSARP